MSMLKTDDMRTTVVIDLVESQTEAVYATQRYSQNDKTNYGSMGNFEMRQTGNTVGSSLHACESRQHRHSWLYDTEDSCVAFSDRDD
jgi:hypothetical protein